MIILEVRTARTGETAGSFEPLLRTHVIKYQLAPHPPTNLFVSNNPTDL